MQEQILSLESDVMPSPRISRELVSANFLTNADNFAALLDARAPVALLQRFTPHITLLGRLRYYQLTQSQEVSDLTPAFGELWQHAAAAVLELSARAISWSSSRSIDAEHPLLSRVWDEAISLAWHAEVVARSVNLERPHRAWQAAMLLAAAAIGEQLRLLEDSPGNEKMLCLGPATLRQLDSLVIQFGLSPALSVASAQSEREGSGPWNCVALAFLLSERAGFERPWVTRVFERLRAHSPHPVLLGTLSREIQRHHRDHRELAQGAWIIGRRVGKV